MDIIIIIFFGVFFGILLIAGIAVAVMYNRLVALKNRMQEAWSGIDVFLKKRHDLIPNLVATVKGYAAHEHQTFEEVTRYRTEAMQSQEQQAQIKSEIGLGNALGRLFAVAENYPDLKANTNFLELQKQLSGLEEDLSSARRYYNGTVRENNIYIERFPSNIIAGMFKFAKGTFFEIEKIEINVPVVSF